MLHSHSKRTNVTSQKTTFFKCVKLIDLWEYESPKPVQLHSNTFTQSSDGCSGVFEGIQNRNAP